MLKLVLHIAWTRTKTAGLVARNWWRETFLLTPEQVAQVDAREARRDAGAADVTDIR